MKPWQEKANRLIYNSAKASFLQANTKPNGELYRRHVPYTVPQIACDLIDCLNRDDEEMAKAIFLSYDGMKLTY